MNRLDEHIDLPTVADINVFDSLDEQAAVRRFLGKTLNEVETWCRDGFALDVTQDLYWIGPRAFNFYVEAVVRYLKSEASLGDSDAVNGFLGMTEFRLDDDPHPVVHWPTVLEGLNAVLDNYENFDVTPELYGDLRPRYAAIRQQLTAISLKS